MARAMAITALVSLVALVARPASAGEPPRPLALTVNPSGFEAGHASLDDLMARRERRNAFLFRSICRGCGRHEALVEPGADAFDPQASLARQRPR